MEATNTVEMVTGAVLSRIDALAAKLGVGIEHFWPIFVKQQFTTGLLDCGLSLILFVLVILCVRGMTSEKADHDGFFTICLIGTIIGTIFFFISGYCGIMEVSNPEYFALKSAMEMMK
jgi:hypothetical protein